MFLFHIVGVWRGSHITSCPCRTFVVTLFYSSTYQICKEYFNNTYCTQAQSRELSQQKGAVSTVILCHCVLIRQRLRLKLGECGEIAVWERSIVIWVLSFQLILVSQAVPSCSVCVFVCLCCSADLNKVCTTTYLIPTLLSNPAMPNSKSQISSTNQGPALDSNFMPNRVVPHT